MKWQASFCHRGIRVKDQPTKKYSGQNVRGAEHASPYPVSRLGAPMSLVDTAAVIQAASETIALRTNAQLEVIVEQMQALQEQAREIMAQASLDVELSRAECRFQRVPGQLYHLYERADGRRYFSMLAPDEYSRGAPHRFVASYRYEHGERWTRADQLESEDRRRQAAQRFVQSRLLKE